jgi:uncharacterized protein (TIGR02145 family)
MRSKLTKIALAAGLGLSLAFTFSCSSNDSGGKLADYSQSSSSSIEKSSSSLSPCGDVSIEDYDIGDYKTVVIGDQTWMAENLNYNAPGSKCYGENGQDLTTPTKPITLSDDEIQANCTKYSRLYNWATAMALPCNCNATSCASQIGEERRGICPSGWHIPSAAEWSTLMQYLNPNCTPASSCNDVATLLKVTSGWESNGNGSDEFGFSALPGGAGIANSNFADVRRSGFWWSTMEGDASHAYIRRILYNRPYAYWDNYDKDNFYSVRCVKD